MGLRYTEFEVPQVRNVQMSIENVKFEQFRKEIGSGDKDFSGRTKCILFSYIIFCNTFMRVFIITEKLFMYLHPPYQTVSSLERPLIHFNNSTHRL